jgi:hypothetical protein
MEGITRIIDLAGTCYIVFSTTWEPVKNPDKTGLRGPFYG